jgi:hypothetical protein
MTDTQTTAAAPEAQPLIERTVPAGVKAAVQRMLAEIEAIPGDVTRELSYAKTKVHEAYEWLENHFVTGGTVIKADAEEVAADAQAGAAKVEGAVDAVEKAV